MECSSRYLEKFLNYIKKLNDSITLVNIPSTLFHLSSFVPTANVYKVPLSITTVAISCLSCSFKFNLYSKS